MRDDFRHARAAPLPAESSIASRFAGSDLADCFAIALPPTGTRDILTLSRFVLDHSVPWVSALLYLRDGVMRLFGVKTSGQLRSAPRSGSDERIDFFRIHAVSTSELILGEDDRHLDFRLSLLLKTHEAERRDELLVTTVVHCHNLLGRVYLATILPFHRLIARSMLSRAAQRGWPS
jgi:Protein of unknown function (DUF2867)